MKVKFFDVDGHVDACAFGAGVYQIKIGLVHAPEQALPLYIGESFSMICRCSEHLYAVFCNDPAYFGLSADHLHDSRLELIVEVYQSVEISKDMSYRDRDVLLRKRERDAIITQKPLSQTGFNDHLRSDRVDVVGQAISKMLDHV